MSKEIVIKGARVNNLKNLDLSIPREKMVVITGVSGSGKSTLAFDTIFAEGQRRFVESLSSFARQFLGRVSKPDADEISRIPPAIAIEQKVNTRNPRSTVGSTTEIYDYIRLLYARIGRSFSPLSGEEVKAYTTPEIVRNILTLPMGKRVYLLAPVSWGEGGGRVETLLALREEGYSRLWRGGEVVQIEAYLSGELKLKEGEELYLLIDRVELSKERECEERLYDSINTLLSVKSVGGEKNHLVVVVLEGEEELISYSTLFERDGLTFEEPTPHLFSYNSPVGACPECSGYGNIVGIDPTLVVPNEELSIYEEAVACWKGESMSYFYEQLVDSAHKFDFPLHTPYNQLSEEHKELLWNGNEHFTGITPFFTMLEEGRYKIQYRIMLSRYSGKTLCPLCKGKRLREEALYVKVAGKDISELMVMTIEQLYHFFKELKLSPYEESVASRVIKEILLRVELIFEVGLPYLTLERASRTLSGGESQRINLVSSIGSSLVGSLYILDEPTIGLHSRDSARLIEVLYRLRDLGNTLLVVEHDEEIMRASDLIVDIGPFAGSYGGEVVFKGSPKELLKVEGVSKEQLERSLTLQYLSGTKRIALPKKRREWRDAIEIKGAAEHNLKEIDVKFPLGVLSAVTGVSGSGKSTLVREILYPALNRKINRFGAKPGNFRELVGNYSKISAVEYVDQNPIGRSSRSNPATYLKVYDDIRRLFSEQPYAKMNGYGHSHFSFNIDGGRCPECEGEGMIKIEMQFMADVKMVCESCNGLRFKPDILEVKYKGLSISDVLKLRVDEAIAFFGKQSESAAKRVAEKLYPLRDVGLSYVELGQSSSTLSGGESQRVKLASFLAKESSNNPLLFIFDEPTTGLHFEDIGKLLDSFNALIEKGHSVVVVEHNLEVIKSADWLIDLGPEGGDKGGELLFQGTPEELVKVEKSFTGRALLPYLA